ncbi:uncharacterized protein ACRADG_001744 [Cochliomyia hominivorax]
MSIHSNDSSLENMQNLNKNLKITDKRKRFNINDYVEYSSEDNKSICLIRDCDKIMNGCRSSRIKQHYVVYHNMNITLDSKESLRAVEDDRPHLNLKKYFKYDRLFNKSICKTLYCNAILEGNNLDDLMAHYNLEHNIQIQPEEDLNTEQFSLEDFDEDYDEVNKTYKCLFRNCYAIQVDDVADVRKHYREKHRIFIKLKKNTTTNSRDHDNGVAVTEGPGTEDCEPSDNFFKQEFFPPERITGYSQAVTTTNSNPQQHVEKRGKHIDSFRFEEYMETAPGTIKSKCLIENCGKILKLHNAFNAKRHYRTIHFMYILHGSVKTLEECENLLATGYTESSYYMLKKFVLYDRESKLYKCLFRICSHKMPLEECAIKSHYCDQHSIVIEKYTPDKQKAIRDINENKEIKRSARGRKGYSDIFKPGNYMDYQKEIDRSKCLLKHCKLSVKGCTLDRIKRHYHSLHNMIIILKREELPNYEEIKKDINDKLSMYNFHTSSRCLFTICNELLALNWDSIQRHYYEKHQILIDDNNLMKQRKLQSFGNAPDNENQQNFKFVEYQMEANISKCLLRSCKSCLKGHHAGRIKKHFRNLHHMIIIQRINTLAYETIKRHIDDIKSMKKFHTSSSKCLFNYCDEILKKNWDSIQRHYYEKHLILIDDKNLGNQKRRGKRTYSDDDDTSSTEAEAEEESGNSESEEYNEENSSINSPELLNDHDNDNSEEDNESVIANPLTSEIDETPLDLKDLEIPINVNVNSKNPQENPYILEFSNEIHLTETKFLKLCLGLLINYDLPLKIFNDKEYFKPLLAPYEEQIDSDVNAQEMENLLQKAYHVIVEELRNIFKNKIICLELYLIRYELRNYVIFNIRFWAEDKIHNRIIGFLPITETTTTLPISNYLNQFHIEEKQIYVKTILTINSEHNEIYKIYENLCKHNPDLKKHPIQELQIILRNFKQKYSKEIKSWQEITNYKQNLDLDVWQNLKDFAKHVKHKLETNSQCNSKLKNAKQFFKTLQIFWNFFQKLSKEQYVAGDLYRDWLHCELELREEITKTHNLYAETLNEQLMKCKNNLWESPEFMGALYLDIRFNFFGTLLINEQKKLNAKLILADIWERLKNSLPTFNSYNNYDDEYAILNGLINDVSSLTIQDKLNMWLPGPREPFSFNVLQISHNNSDLIEIKELRKIVFLFSASQYISKYLKLNFLVFKNDGHRFNKFVIKCNQYILDLKEYLIFNN